MEVVDMALTNLPQRANSISAQCSPLMRSPPEETDERRIAARISTLLRHYYVEHEPAAARQAQLEDWLEDLAEFGSEIVAEACRQWRQGPDGKKRPSPAHIRELAVAEKHYRERRALLPPPNEMARLRERRAHEKRLRDEAKGREARAYLDKCARNRDYADFNAMADAWARDHGYAN